VAYVIAEPCIGTKDNSCVEVCPVDCIHPTPDEADHNEVEQLYIDPDECIDCDACGSTPTTSLRRSRGPGSGAHALTPDYWITGSSVAPAPGAFGSGGALAISPPATIGSSCGVIAMIPRAA